MLRTEIIFLFYTAAETNSQSSICIMSAESEEWDIVNTNKIVWEGNKLNDVSVLNLIILCFSHYENSIL